MRTRFVKPGLVAVVLIAALAVGVETFRPGPTRKAYAFSAEIQANTALDLDPKAAVPIRDVQPADFDVTWDSAGGGALKIMPGSSARIWRITLVKPGWDDAIEWAFSHLGEIGESTATSVVPTEETPFAAVLTNEGNLAVIEVGLHKQNRAWLSWRVEKAISPGYSPVQIMTLPALDEESAVAQPCAFDFDSGKVVEIPAPTLHLPADGLLAWLEQSGVDAIARTSEEGDGLVGVGLIFWTWMPSGWADTDPVELRQEMRRATAAPRRPLLFQEDRYQYTVPFKTREGAIGMLQILAVDKAKRTVQFRYRMLQEEGGDTPSENDAESQRLAASVDRLMRFGLMAWKYAEEHGWRYPDTIDELNDYARRFDQDWQWILDHVGYVGAGKVGDDPADTLIAYDKTLLTKGKGTNGVFRDGHAEFIEPKRLPQFGLAPEPPDAPALPRE